MTSDISKIVICAGSNEDLVRMQSNRHVQASALSAMKRDDKFFDVNLFGVLAPGTSMSDSNPIRAHKAVLASVSKHLYELFTSDDYTDSHRPEYHIENVDHEILRVIVDFVYTDNFTSDKATAVDVIRNVLVGAKYLLMTDLADACEAFLASEPQVELSNCMSLWCFGRKYSCLTLMHATSTFIAENIGVMPKNEQFWGMVFDDCAKLLLSEALIAADANARCVAAIAWLNHDDSRASHVHDILNMIPLTPGSITISTILVAHKCNMLRTHAPEVLLELMAGTLKKIDQNLPVVNWRSRSAMQSWYVIGGEQSPTSFLSYDVKQRLWTKLPSLPIGRYAAGACALANQLIVIGGKKNDVESPDIDKFSLATNTWTSGQGKLCEARCHSATCCDGQCVYAIGGFGDGKYKASVERFDPKSSDVTVVAGLTLPRCSSAAVFDSNTNGIFVAGGFDGCEFVSNIEKYCILTDKWVDVGKLITPHSRLAATLSGDDLYIVGGYGIHEGQCVEIFNIRSGQTRTASNLLESRIGCSATTIDDGNVICVVGGSSPAVETYDIREGKWTKGVIVPNMPEVTRYFGFAVV